MPTYQNVAADKPVITQAEDQFQRYGFSKRIADTILHRKSKECIVLGVYGAWGKEKLLC